MDAFFKLIAAGPLFFVSAWLLMVFQASSVATVGIRPFGYITAMVVTIGLWLTLAPAIGAVGRATGKRKGSQWILRLGRPTPEQSCRSSRRLTLRRDRGRDAGGHSNWPRSRERGQCPVVGLVRPRCYLWVAIWIFFAAAFSSLFSATEMVRIPSR